MLQIKTFTDTSSQAFNNDTGSIHESRVLIFGTAHAAPDPTKAHNISPLKLKIFHRISVFMVVVHACGVHLGLTVIESNVVHP